jgi:hypothetical protein
MVKTTNDAKLCHEHLMKHLENLTEQMHQCQLELARQSPFCPITSLALDQIDHGLKEYVRGERNYLSRSNNDQLMRFQEIIHERDLHQAMVTYRLPINLVKGWNTTEFLISQFSSSARTRHSTSDTSATARNNLERLPYVRNASLVQIFTTEF